MTQTTLPARWDLSDLYPALDSAEFAADLEKLNTALTGLEAFCAQHGIGAMNGAGGEAAFAQAVGGYVERMNEVVLLYRSLSVFLSLHVSVDSYNTAARRKLSEVERVGVRLQKISVPFQAWLGRREAELERLLALPGEAAPESGSAAAHAFFLREQVEQAHFLMAESEEALAAELNLSGGSAWGKLQGTVVSQLSAPFERDGKTELLPMTALINLHADPDPDVRRRAYEAELAAWKQVREPLAAAMNGVKGAAATLNRRRKRQDDLHQSLDQSRIDRQTLEAMMGAMQESFPVFRRYLRAKAERLGYPKGSGLPWWDVFAPLAQPGGEQHYSLDQARDFVVEQFGRFSDELAGFAAQAFQRGWIDSEPRSGKRAGAFCSAIFKLEESRVFANFDGSLDQTFTLAHELGHAYHNFCMKGLPPLLRNTPMTLAETASIFCETIATNAALAAAADGGGVYQLDPHSGQVKFGEGETGKRPAAGGQGAPRQGGGAAGNHAAELAILETSLVGDTQIIVDISSRFLFEKEVFERRAKAELSADELCEIMTRAQQATYGDGLDSRYLHPYMWTWKPHYYSPALHFYNYPYAFGLLFGLGLYAIYEQRGPDFIPDYKALLRSTGQGRAAELARRFGIDIRTPDFWRASLGIIARRVERYCAL